MASLNSGSSVFNSQLSFYVCDSFWMAGKRITKNTYIVISGSTDGSVAFWDVTESVEAFMQRVSCLHVEKSIDFQKRPRTGRGSQGGRWWKSVDAAVTAKGTSTDFTMMNENGVSSDNALDNQSSSAVILKDPKMSSFPKEIASSRSRENFDDFSSRVSEIKPLHVLPNAHQSGVNCLHLCSQLLQNSLRYNIVSGGDDQALSFLQFVVVPSLKISNLDGIGIEGDTSSKSGNLEYQGCSIKFLYQKKIMSAHSSAVKGTNYLFLIQLVTHLL